jgi:hypothetical protein
MGSTKTQGKRKFKTGRVTHPRNRNKTIWGLATRVYNGISYESEVYFFENEAKALLSIWAFMDVEEPKVEMMLTYLEPQ